MPKMITDWVKVAESGKTIDGRTIEASWLTDAAELYSKEKYTAIITLEHYPPEWAGNYGTVEALKAETADGVVSLYAKLAPNDRLVNINRSGEKLFTSIKVHPNFGDTGQAYVYQIGVTDTPASMGTSQLQFRAGDGEQVLPGVALSFSVEDDQSLINKIKALVFSAPRNQEPEDKDEDMKPEELQAAIKEAVTECFSSFKETQQNPKEEPKASGNGEAAAIPVTSIKSLQQQGLQ